MWKKTEDQPSEPEKKAEVQPAVEARREALRPSSEPAKVAPPRTGGSTSVIGASLTIRGAVKGSEDLLIQGTVEGEISLPKNAVVVGAEGRVEASIEARVIRVEGEVVGDMNGLEQVVVASAGLVRGNITSPRVILEDGAKLKGSIDMEIQPTETRDSRTTDSRNASSKSVDTSGSEKKPVAPVVQ